MKVLELFAGSRSIGKAAEARGHQVFSTDIEPFEKMDYVVDILEIDLKKIPFVPDMIWGSSPCFIHSELVLSTRGYVPISEIRVGDKVLTHKSRWRKVEAIGRKKVSSIKNIKGYGVDNIKCTPNHPFLVRENHSSTIRKNGKSKRTTTFSESKWVSAQDIEGLYWASPVKIESYEHTELMDPYLIGRWLGDGWCSKNHVFLCCGKHEIQEFEKKLNQYSKNFSWNKYEEKTTYRFSLPDHVLVEWLTFNFGAGAENKKIPGWVFGMDEEKRVRFLQGYIDSDGCKEPNGYKTSSVSRSLTYSISLLARTLDYTSGVVKNIRKDTCVIEGRIVNQAVSWTANITNKNTDRKFFNIFDDGLGYGKVRSVKTEGWNSYVYNLQIEEDNTYVVNNIVVHNCTAFSVASMGKHWTGGKKAYIPKTETAKLGMSLAQKTIEIIEHFKKINPNLVWYMENPRGVLRHMPFMKELPIMNTITYCKYGDIRMKPTDIWTNNDFWFPRSMCKNNGFGLKDLNGETWALNQVGKPCHVSAPRGAKTGTQGLKGDYFRSMLPEELCEELIKATELCIQKKHGNFLYDPIKYCRYCFYQIEPEYNCKCAEIHEGTHCIVCGEDHEKNLHKCDIG